MGAYFKVQSFVFMPIFGMNNGLTPIVSHNYGAKRPDRIREAIHFALWIGGDILLLGTAVFLFPGALLGFFDADAATLAAGIPALRILCLSFLPAGISILLSSAFQALGAPSSAWALACCGRSLPEIPPPGPASGLSGGLRRRLVRLCDR